MSQGEETLPKEASSAPESVGEDFEIHNLESKEPGSSGERKSTERLSELHQEKEQTPKATSDAPIEQKAGIGTKANAEKYKEPGEILQAKKEEKREMLARTTKPPEGIVQEQPQKGGGWGWGFIQSVTSAVATTIEDVGHSATGIAEQFVSAAFDDDVEDYKGDTGFSALGDVAKKLKEEQEGQSKSPKVEEEEDFIVGGEEGEQQDEDYVSNEEVLLEAGTRLIGSLIETIDTSSEKAIDAIENVDPAKIAESSLGLLERVGKVAYERFENVSRDVMQSVEIEQAPPKHRLRTLDAATVVQEAPSSKPQPSSFESNFEECLGTVHMQALEMLATRRVMLLHKGDSPAALEEIEAIIGGEEETSDSRSESTDSDEEELIKKELEPLPRVDLNRRARMKRKIVSSFVEAALKKVSSFLEIFAEACESLDEDGFDLIQQHLEDINRQCMLLLSELSATSVELLLRVAESFLVAQLETETERTEEQRLNEAKEKANYTKILLQHLERDVSTVSSAFAKSIGDIITVSKEQNVFPADPLKAKHLRSMDQETFLYSGKAVRCLEEAKQHLVPICKSLFFEE